MNQIKNEFPNIKILPPSINDSGLIFKAKDGNIIYGLSAVKSIGKTAEKIIEERNNGNFTNFSNFYNRVKPKKNVSEGLICVGVFEEFGINRRTLMENQEFFIKDAERMKKQVSGQIDFFGDVEDSQSFKNYNEYGEI